MTLVYVLWETADEQDVWRLLPQQVYLETGILAYNYDFTELDVRFFLEGTIDLDSLDASWTQNQIFRVVVVPADNIDGVDLTNIDAVMQANNIHAFEKK